MKSVPGRRVLVVASRSKHKLSELRRMLKEQIETGSLELFDLEEAERALSAAPIEIEEDADTFAGNAEKKARTVAESLGSWALGDDSGLCVDALDGAPGVRSARFSGEAGGERDSANNEKLLRVLERVPHEKRGAAFVCALCLASPDGRVWHVEGKSGGLIAEAPRGEGGFGYDPLFLSEDGGLDGSRTFAELSPEEKDRVSHRGRALREMKLLVVDIWGT